MRLSATTTTKPSARWPHGYVAASELVPPRRPPSGPVLGLLHGSHPSREAKTQSPRSVGRRERGVVLVMVLGVIAVLSILVVDLNASTSTGFHLAASERDRVQAEYLAKSGLDLTRLLISNEAKVIRKVLSPIYQMLIGRGPPQINVWDFANEILRPFADFKSVEQMGEGMGMDFSLMEGLSKTPGTFEVVAIPENSLININVPVPLFFTGDRASQSIAMQLYALMGGYQSPESPYDPLFAQRDADGQFTTRLDIVSAIIDWYDADEIRTIFDPGTAAITQSGSEDDIYEQFRDPYVVKNAPYDSLEELRLIRGVSDDFWATFVETDPEDPKSRQLTVYASGAVNVNHARPEVLIARLCSFLQMAEQSLCADPMEAARFITLLNLLRSVVPISLFSRPNDFLDFLQGKGKIYNAIAMFLPPDSELMFTPVRIPSGLMSRKRGSREGGELAGAFLTTASIFTIQSTGIVGRTRVRMRAVVNLHNKWTPPPGNPGELPSLGVFHHYRVD